MTEIQHFNICRQIIGDKPTVTQNEIENAVTNLLRLDPTADAQRLIRALESHYNIQIGKSLILEGDDARHPWLNAYSTEHTSFPFWERYKRYLIEQKGLSNKIANQLDTLTDRILDNLFNPTMMREANAQIFKKGMVVGQVQSGKTSNYTGLICKAADAGFNLIIILAGIHNSLRSQTQERIDEGFLGFTTLNLRDNNNRIGVGNDFNNIKYADELVAHALTTASEDGDFNLRQAQNLGINFATPSPIVLVVKKNGSPLRNLIRYFEQKQQDIPSKSLLLIDDEADNASVNTRNEDEDPAAINGYIRQLLGCFDRKAYVGYTATPYANIFIDANDDDDLFPKDFIIALPAPSNYIGPDKIFATNASADDDDISTLPIVRIINDYADFVPTRHRRGDELPVFDRLPESLKHAVKSFILVCAIRYARGQKKAHNSMLIHVSRFTNWQGRIKEIIDELFGYYRDAIILGDKPILEELRSIYEGEGAEYASFRETTNSIIASPLKDIDTNFEMPSWQKMIQILPVTTRNIQIKEINGAAGEALDYSRHKRDGLSVIAIGGDRLSRGLTLEGLSISYFLRASRMYDTLMQMGRWFGYRPGYVDLCRIYLSTELAEWFQHITLADEELRAEFKYMVEAGSTPDKFRLKVRNHPGQLQITSAGKMRNGIRMSVSWAGRLVETYQLSTDRNVIRNNFNATSSLIARLFKQSQVEGVKKNNSFLWRNISPQTIVNFLSEYQVPESLKKVDLERIIDYIHSCININELTSWNVVVMNKVNGASASFNLGNGINGGCFDRTRADDVDFKTYYIRKNHIIGNQKDELLDLPEKMITEALQRTIEIKEQNDEYWDKDYPSPQVVRREFRPREIGLLIIYPLNAEKATPVDKNGHPIIGAPHFFTDDTPFIGFAISFPASNDTRGVEYTVNQVEDFYRTEEEFEADENGNG